MLWVKKSAENFDGGTIAAATLSASSIVSSRGNFTIADEHANVVDANARNSRGLGRVRDFIDLR
jgi:hypothetical protein